MTAVINPIPRSVADLTTGTIVASVEIAVAPERVFKALTDSTEIVQWWGSADTYRTEAFSADLRVGGRWQARGRAVDGKPYQVEGEILELDPPRRLVQTWIPDWAPGLKTTLTYRLEAIAGGTRLTVRHEGFGAHRETFEGHTIGWERVLGFLKNHLAPGGHAGFAARYLNPLRLASYLLILFALGHTMGALVNLPSFDPQADAVLGAMRSTHFRCESSECTWFGFYLGFGIIVSIFFLASAAIAWFLGGLDRSKQHAWAPISWTLFVSHAANAVVAWLYFFIIPQMFATAVAALLAYQCLFRDPRARRLRQLDLGAPS